MGKESAVEKRLSRLEEAVFGTAATRTPPGEQEGVEAQALANTIPSGPEGDALRAAVEAAQARDAAADAAAAEAEAAAAEAEAPAEPEPAPKAKKAAAKK